MLVNQFLEFLSHHIPENRYKRYVLAVSGGMDSMVMLHLFKSQGLNCVVAHCNFNLRGEESGRDETFVNQSSELLGVKCYVKHFDIKKEKESDKESTQVLARKLRYQWFEQLRQELGFDFICTAHHQRDNVETILQRFMNGAFPEGMQGIPSINGFILRPMLKMKYDELFAFAAENNISFRTDSSNLKQDYTRNKIRQIILPALQEVFGEQYQNNIESVATHYQKYYALIRKEAKNLLVQKNHWFEIDLLLLIHREGNAALLYEAIKDFGFNWMQCTDICGNLLREQGTFYENQDRTYQLVFANEVLQLLPEKKKDEIQYFLFNGDKVLDFQFHHQSVSLRCVERKNVLNFEKGYLYIDYDLIQNKEITLRHWKTGDEFTPFGMHGTKSVSDFLKDSKLSPAEKQGQLIFCVEDRIAAIIGQRIDDRFKLTDKSKNVLQITSVFNSGQL